MKKFLKIAAICIVAVVLLGLILAPQVLKSRPQLLEGHQGKFTKQTLDTICGVELRQTDDKWYKISCTRYWNNRNVPTEFDDLRFYVFDSNHKAKKAFNTIKKNHFSEIVDEGKDYVKGVEAGTMDAEVVSYYYIHNNLIIEVFVEVYSEWAYNPDDPSTYPEPYIIDQDYIDQLIRKNF